MISIRWTAVSCGVFFFFVIAVWTWLMGFEPATCAVRAMSAGVAVYAIVRVAGGLIFNIIVNAIVEQRLNRFNDGE